MSGKLASPLSKRVAVDHPMDVPGKAEHDVLALEFSRLPCLLEQYSSWDLHFSFSFRSVNFSQVWAPLTGHCDPAVLRPSALWPGYSQIPGHTSSSLRLERAAAAWRRDSDSAGAEGSGTGRTRANPRLARSCGPRRE